MKFVHIAIVPILACLASCQQSGGSPSQLAEEIAELKKQLADIDSRAASDREEIEDIRKRGASMESSLGRYSRAVFDPSDDGGYMRIDTGVGPVLVSLSDIQPFADGTRAKFELGNISAADILNPAIAIKWNRKPPKLEEGAKPEETIKYVDDLENWLASEQEKTVELTQTLRSGYWNVVTVNLPGIPPSNLGELTVTVNVSQVRLRKP